MADIPSSVRVWPTAAKLFEDEGCYTLDEIQNKYFMEILPSRNGKFRYPSSGIKADRGAIILFQYDKEIIALAELIGMEKYDEPENGYSGHLIFNKYSIKTFEPINESTLQKAFHFSGVLNNAKHDLSVEYYFDFENRLKNVKFNISDIEPIDLIKPPDRIKSSVFRIIRDTELARRVKIKHNYKCQICGHRIEIPGGGFYAESHHLKPLGEPHCGPDIESNIVCVCPNHHAELDYGVRRLNLSELEDSDGHPINDFFIDYHNSNVYKKR
jgi:hypothetical protein